MDATFLATTVDVHAPRPAKLLRRTQESNTWVATLLLRSASYALFSDGGGSFIGIRSGPYAFQGFFPIPGTPTAIALTDDAQLLQSVDRGASWSRVEGTAPRPADRFAIANDGTTVYACGNGRPSSGGRIWNDGALARRRDGGKTWTQTHLFTASAEERNAVLATLAYFVDEQVAFYGLVNPSPLTVPVYRFYRAASGTHAYATTEAERNALLASGAIDEGIAYHVLASAIKQPGALAVHRFVNATTGGELFATDDDERDDIRNWLPQFAYRGVVFTAYPAPAGQ